MKISDDGTLLAACCSDNKILIWQSEKQRLVGAIQMGESLIIKFISISFCNKYLAAGYAEKLDYHVKVFNLKTLQEEKSYSYRVLSEMTSLSFCPYNLLLMSTHKNVSSNQNIRI